MAKKPRRNWLLHPPEHCGKPARLVTGAEIYPHRPDLYLKRIWRCQLCDARVGVHEHSLTAAPLGVLADAAHRDLKVRAHEVFDRLWRDGPLSRNQAYRWLRKAMDAERSVHIGWSSPEELERIIEICNTQLPEPGDE